jgi:hypothetical protein
MIQTYFISVLGEPCEQNSQCYLTSNETHKVECRNGLCLCGYAYTQTEDLDCKSGKYKDTRSLQILKARSQNNFSVLSCIEMLSHDEVTQTKYPSVVCLKNYILDKEK